MASKIAISASDSDDYKNYPCHVISVCILPIT